MAVVRRSVVTVPLVCRARQLPLPTSEYRFAPPRLWRFDWAWPARRVALEVQGGNWNRGRHTRAGALRSEYEKLNAAAVRGWRVLYCEPADIVSGAIGDVLEQMQLHGEP